MEQVKGFLLKIAARQDLALVMLLMIIITVMIIPLPTVLMDALIVLNMSLTILILMVSIYLKRPDDFSVFPSVILLATTFRLAISISTTRLILSQGDAGDIVRTFGVFVTQGSVVVGMVIFLIITTVQFIVITKGSERVAEVAARFTLDAMPGRQMAIDAELRNGDIDQEQASKKRQALQKENQFFGAMDGAMKFVKGDSIAGIIIILVNLAGGFGIGTMSEGMTAGDAASLYSRLTIGDGLISQIPALLLAICAGAVVTRVTTDDQTDLGTDIVGQLAHSSRALIIAGIILAIIGLVPGFPLVFFLIAGGILGGSGYLINRKEHRQEQEAQAIDQPAVHQSAHQSGGQPSEAETNQPQQVNQDTSVKPTDIVSINTGSKLFKIIDKETFALRRKNSLLMLEHKMGQFLPEFGFTEKAHLEPYQFEVVVEGVPVFSTSMLPDHIIAVCEKEVLDLIKVTASPLEQEWPIRSAWWVEASEIEKLHEADVQVLDLTTTMIDVTTYFLAANAQQIIGFQQVQHILQLLQQEQPELAGQVSSSLNATQLLEVIRQLVSENVPIYARRVLFEGLLQSTLKQGGTEVMVETARHALRRQICMHFADETNFIASYIVEPDLESQLRRAMSTSNNGPYLALDATLSQALLAQVGRINHAEDLKVTPPVIVTSSDIRSALKDYIKSHNCDLDVIAFQEIAIEFHLRPIGTIAVTDTWHEDDEKTDTSKKTNTPTKDAA